MIGALIVGAVLIAVFVFWESRAPLPMMPLEYFRSRAFSAAGGVAFPFSFALIGSVFWIAQMLQVGMCYSPLASGIRMLVFTVMPMIFALLAGIGADKIGNRPAGRCAGSSRSASRVGQPARPALACSSGYQWLAHR